jgi:hypothetical protein
LRRTPIQEKTAKDFKNKKEGFESLLGIRISLAYEIVPLLSESRILDEFDIIECFEVPGQRLQVGETTKRQMDLYTKLGVTPPASLQ